MLTVYDCIMLEVPIKYVQHATDIMMPYCMVEHARAPRLNFSIAIDTDVSKRWDEALLFEDFIDMGFSSDYALSYCKRDNDELVIHRDGTKTIN